MIWTSKWRWPSVRTPGLAHRRERLGQDVVEVLLLLAGIARVVELLAPAVRERAQLVVGAGLHLGLEAADDGRDRLQRLELAAFAGVEDLVEESHGGSQSTGVSSRPGPSPRARSTLTGSAPAGRRRGPTIAADGRGGTGAIAPRPRRHGRHGARGGGRHRPVRVVPHLAGARGRPAGLAGLAAVPGPRQPAAAQPPDLGRRATARHPPALEARRERHHLRPAADPGVGRGVEHPGGRRRPPGRGPGGAGSSPAPRCSASRRRGR